MNVFRIDITFARELNALGEQLEEQIMWDEPDWETHPEILAQNGLIEVLQWIKCIGGEIDEDGFVMLMVGDNLYEKWFLDVAEAAEFIRSIPDESN